jgi:hypothetical protein
VRFDFDVFRIKILAWWSGAFAGDFAFYPVFLDGKLWWICGGLMVITWLLNACFLNAKNISLFQFYF